MFGIIYLLIAWLAGDRIAGLLAGSGKSLNSQEGSDTADVNGASWWLRLCAGFGVGILLITWAVYFCAWFLHTRFGMEQPLLYANAIVLGLTVQILLLRTVWCIARGKALSAWGKLCPVRGSEVFFALIFLGFLIFIFFYVFHVRDGKLYSGLTVFSDYAPHTAMIRSFSLGNNYPTAYPHFGGEDIRYHFMFQFLAGNLEYLGMRIDLAYNVISILSMEAFWLMLLVFIRRIGGGTGSWILAVLLFVMRSGTTFFRYVWEHFRAGDLVETLQNNSAFIGYTENENWGLWNFNVYLNQRHLAFALVVGAVALWFFWDHVEAAAASEKKGAGWAGELFFSAAAWKFRAPEAALLTGLILGLTTFWNGAVVIGTLLILMGFGLFSWGKLDYVLTAAVAVGTSLLQSRIFIRGEAVSPSFYLGFIAQPRTFPGVLLFLVQITGFYFLGVFFLLPLFRRSRRSVLLSCLIPVVFAFTVSLTPDINVNQKYIMIAYAFLAVFWGRVLAWLYSSGFLKKVLALLLTVCLITTGAYDFFIILRNNGEGHRIPVDLDSGITWWLSSNLDESDLLLSPQYSLNEVTLSGSMLYCGWPYYAWSAGYDTYYRAGQQKIMYTTDSPDELRKLVSREGITYILYEDDMMIDEESCREDVIRAVYPLVFESGRYRVYKVSDYVGPVKSVSGEKAVADEEAVPEEKAAADKETIPEENTVADKETIPEESTAADKETVTVESTAADEKASADADAARDGKVRSKEKAAADKEVVPEENTAADEEASPDADAAGDGAAVSEQKAEEDASSEQLYPEVVMDDFH